MKGIQGVIFKAPARYTVPKIRPTIDPTMNPKKAPTAVKTTVVHIVRFKLRLRIPPVKAAMTWKPVEKIKYQ